MTKFFFEDDVLAYKCQNNDCGFYFTQKVEWGNYFCPKCKYSTRPIFDYYLIFGLTGEFSDSDIKEKYKKLSLLYHPDKNPNKNKKDVSEEFDLIRKAFETLTDEVGKEIYDHELITLKNFIKGTPPIQQNQMKTRSMQDVSGWLILSMVGILLSGCVYYFTNNFIYTSISAIAWISVGMIWKVELLKFLSYLVEISMVLGMGYLLFEKKWIESLILLLMLLTYFLIKRSKSQY